MLELQNVSLESGGKTLFEVDSLRVCEGEVLCVIGPNGAGKSSLLKVLALLEKPTRGEVRLEGERVNGKLLVEKRRRIAVVFQEPLLYDTSAYENVAAGLKFRGTPRSEIRERVLGALRLLRIEHLAQRPARVLSGGEAQRVNLARALVLEPDVFLLDEPLAGLDPAAAQRLLDDLRDLVRQRKLTTVFVTHDRSEALAIADRLAVMMEGRIVQIGLVEEVFSRPASAEIATFVGAENILPGRVLERGETCLVEVEGGGVLRAAQCSEHEDVFVSLRPEDVLVQERGSVQRSSARNRLEGRIVSLAPSGVQYRVEVDAGFPIVSFLTKQAVEDLELAPGSKVEVLFKATAVHLIAR